MSVLAELATSWPAVLRDGRRTKKTNKGCGVRACRMAHSMPVRIARVAKAPQRGDRVCARGYFADWTRKRQPIEKTIECTGGMHLPLTWRKEKGAVGLATRRRGGDGDGRSYLDDEQLSRSPGRLVASRSDTRRS